MSSGLAWLTSGRTVCFPGYRVVHSKPLETEPVPTAPTCSLSVELVSSPWVTSSVPRRCWSRVDQRNGRAGRTGLDISFESVFRPCFFSCLPTTRHAIIKAIYTNDMEERKGILYKFRITSRWSRRRFVRADKSSTEMREQKESE